MRRTVNTKLLPALALTSSLVLLAACGSAPTRSVAAYCSYFYGEGGQLRQRFIESSGNAKQDPLGAMAAVFADIPEAANFLHQLSLRAPEEIAPDVQSLAEALNHIAEQQGNAASDPLEALAGGLMQGLAASGAEQRVNQYTKQHCGPPPGG